MGKWTAKEIKNEQKKYVFSFDIFFRTHLLWYFRSNVSKKKHNFFLHDFFSCELCNRATGWKSSSKQINRGKCIIHKSVKLLKSIKRNYRKKKWNRETTNEKCKSKIIKCGKECKWMRSTQWLFELFLWRKSICCLLFFCLPSICLFISYSISFCNSL